MQPGDGTPRSGEKVYEERAYKGQGVMIYDTAYNE